MPEAPPTGSNTAVSALEKTQPADTKPLGKLGTKTFCLAELRKVWLILAVVPFNFSGTE